MAILNKKNVRPSKTLSPYSTWSTRTPPLTVVLHDGAGDGKALSVEQTGALPPTTSESAQQPSEMNPIILPIVQTRRLRLEKFNNLPEVIELVK